MKIRRPAAVLTFALLTTVVPAAGAEAVKCDGDGSVASMSFSPGTPLDAADVAEVPLAVATANPARSAPLGPTTVDVWFHVIMDAEEPSPLAPPTTLPVVDGEVSDETIGAQMDVLDDAFDGGDVGGAQTPFSFTLAGVTRTVAPGWFQAGPPGSSGEREMKATLREGGAAVLNVYTLDVGDEVTGGGWGTFPWSYRFDPSFDGVVIDFQNLPGGTVVGYSEGDTLVHEIGHWLGLWHTFQNGCDGVGDEVADTPAEATPSESVCVEGRDTCASDGTDPIHNYMDYSSNACTTEFTDGQSTRMQDQWTAYRAQRGKPAKRR